MARRAHTSTRAVHAGETRIKPHHAVTTPIIQSSTFTFTDTADLVNFMETQRRNQIGDRLEYGRYGNPTVAAVERKLADLDGGETAQLFSSGMAAVTITLLSLLSAGNHIVMTDDCYRRTREFVAEFLPRLGVQATQVPVGDYDALEDAIRPNTCVIFSESPTNPYLRVVDVQRIVAIARRHRLHTVIDSTFATPINQRPLEAGINLVIHSATKYLAGHNDLLAGAVIGSRDLIDQVRATQAMVGAICDASTAYLLLRGLKTLSLRVTRQNETGMQVARFLESDPRVRCVYYPGLPSHPQHATAREQMSGFGGVVSFELDGDLAQTTRFVDALQIPYIGPSFGGVESLVEQVVLASYYTLSPEQWAEIGISDTLVRLGVGVEEADDLIADLAQALELALGNRN
jgi:cystathionine gamma-synthase